MPHNPIPPDDLNSPEEGGLDSPEEGGLNSPEEGGGARVDWAALEALAAGELAPEAEAAVRACIATDATWHKAFDHVESVQRQLAGTALFATPPNLLQRVMDQIPGARQTTAASNPPLRLLRWPQLAAGWAAAVLLSLAGWAALAHATPAHAGCAHNVTLVAALKMVPTGLDDDRQDFLPIPALLAEANDSNGRRGLAAAWPWLLGGLLLVSGGTAAALGAHRRALEGVA